MSEAIKNTINYLQQTQTLRDIIEKAGLTQNVAQLQEWQCQRLLATHDDLWQQKRFRPAMQFFIDELYGPKDFSERDNDIARVVPKMAKILPEQAVNSLESAVHLNLLSLQLDFALVKHLQGPLNRDTYAQAYRACDNQNDRELQITYIEKLGEDLAEVVHVKGISTLLMLSRKPAKVAGVIVLHEFLESGFKAFKKLGDVQDFIQPVVQQEKALMRTLFNEPQINPLPEGL